jgi:hypothetical protein
MSYSSPAAKGVEGIEEAMDMNDHETAIYDKLKGELQPTALEVRKRMASPGPCA